MSLNPTDIISSTSTKPLKIGCSFDSDKICWLYSTLDISKDSEGCTNAREYIRSLSSKYPISANLYFEMRDVDPPVSLMLNKQVPYKEQRLENGHAYTHAGGSWHTFYILNPTLYKISPGKFEKFQI